MVEGVWGNGQPAAEPRSAACGYPFLPNTEQSFDRG